MEYLNQITNDNLLDDFIEEISHIKTITLAKEVLFAQKEMNDILLEAVDFCISQHNSQYRKSGEPYAIHPLLVGSIVAFLGGDSDMIISSLMHDVVEDTECTLDTIKNKFGEEVAKLVEGLTKIVSIREDKLAPFGDTNRLRTSALTFRKMLLVSIEDIRVLIIKLCDRLHNMITLDALAPEKQVRISEETLFVYAPIAHRLGIASIKNILEDLSFKYVLPKEYEKIDNFINEHKQQFQINLNKFSLKITELLLLNGFEEGKFEIQKRIKHYYSIYLKMQRKGASIEEILDLMAARIILVEPKDCYTVLGIMHTNFNPLISRFKDYIALPKQNGYQTIHTTVFNDSLIIEAQIRTYDMHRTAEYGIAAHWKYKYSGSLNPKLDWINDIKMKEDEENDHNPEDLYEYAKDSLYIEDIAVYSPKGGIFTLPRGATALDYAYEIHSQVGLKATEAFVNRIKVPLLTELKNGDIVHIITGIEPHYRCSWLSSVKTGKARATIKAFCKQKIKELNQEISIAILQGIFAVSYNMITIWLERENLTKKIGKIAQDSVYLKDVVNAIKKYPEGDRIFPLKFSDKYEIKKQKFINIVVYSNFKIHNAEFDYCCNPKRGDDILGFRYNHNVTVHHKLCERAAKLMKDGDEMIFVKWTRNAPHRYKVILSLENKRGSLAAFLTFLVRLQVDVVSIKVDENSDNHSDFFEIKIELNESLDPNLIKDKIKDKYKIIEFTSATDAYINQEG